MKALAASLGAYAELVKPRLTFLVILSAMTGFYLALPPGAPLAPLFFWRALVGISLVSAGSMALNEWMEREEDAKMRRTQNRPLPSGRLLPVQAALFGAVIALAGLGILIGGGHTAAALLAGATLFLYLGIYTPLKKKTVLCTLVGAVPGALPTITGWAAAAWPLSQRAWILFLILFLWQMPHFYAISWLWREDYVRAGFRILSVEEAAQKTVPRHILAYTLLLLPASLVPFWMGMNGPWYAAGATMLGIFFIVRAAQAVQNIEKFARPVFRASIIYLSVLLLLMVLDKR